MKEEIKLAAKITAKSSLKWFTIIFIGNLVTMIFFFIILFQNSRLAGGGHGSAIGLLVNLFVQNFYGFLLFAGTPIFATLYFIIANKVAIQSTIQQVWENKMGSYIDSKVVLIVDKITASNNLATSVSNGAVLRLKLLEANKNDVESSKIKKKTINYLFRKIKLDDIDFSNKDLKLSEIISFKLNQFVSEAVKPSFLFFWLLMGLQIALLIGAQFYKAN